MMMVMPIPRLVLMYGIAIAGVGTGNNKYNKNKTNSTNSIGDTEPIDGNFMLYNESIFYWARLKSTHIR